MHVKIWACGFICVKLAGRGSKHQGNEGESSFEGFQFLCCHHSFVIFSDSTYNDVVSEI